jgi:beta-lactam-binding protein with PASTA domain
VLLSRQSGLSAIRVPDVRDDSLAGALAKLERAGITPVVIEVPSERVAAGLIIMQSPPPGSSVTRGSDVTLIVSRGRQ